MNNQEHPIVVSLALALGYDGLKDIVAFLLPLIVSHPLLTSIILNVLLLITLYQIIKKRPVR